MAAKYEFNRSADDRFTFDIKAGDDKGTLTSVRCTARASAETGIESVRMNSPNDDDHEWKISSSDEPYCTLKAPTGGVIAKIGMYFSTGAVEIGNSPVKMTGPWTGFDILALRPIGDQLVV